MALEAGSVITLLSGKFNPAAFEQFNAANKKAAESATAAEAQIAASQGRAARAHESAAVSATRAAGANETLAKSNKRMSETIPLRGMELWDKNSQQASKNLSTLGTVAAKGAAIGIVAVGAATVYAAKQAVDFNREMLKISTQAGGSATEVKKLSTEVLAMAGTVPQGPKALAEGLYHIESAGFRGSKAMEMLKAAAMGAAIGGANLEDVSNAMVGTMASQIKGVNGSADAMGQLNAIVGIGNMRMQDLAQAIGTGILPSAHDAGMALKDVGAALATVTDNATPANVTATRLRMTIAMMSAPSAKAVKELKSIGLTSTSLAHDLRQPNGMLVAVEDLKKHLTASGKSAEEQDAILSHVFGGGKSSAVIHTLISQTDRLRQKYDELGRTDGVTKLNKSWAEFQKSEAAAFGELKSGAEAFAITVGQIVLPELTKLGKGLADSLNSFVKSGGAAQVGGGIVSVFSTLGQVVSNIAPAIERIALALVNLGGSLGLGNATELTALIALFATIKTASFVTPMILALGGALSTLWAEMATAPTIGAVFADLAAAAGPVGAVAVGIGLLAGAFILLSGHERSAADAARDATSAMQAEQAAIQALNQAILGQANATFGAQKSDVELAAAKNHLTDVAKQYGKGSKQYRDALQQEKEVALQNSEAHLRLAGEKKKVADESKKGQEEAAKEVAKRKEALELYMAEKGIGGTPGMPTDKGLGLPDDAQGIKEKAQLTKLTKEYLEALVRQGGASLNTQIQLSRVLNGQPLILEKSAASVAKLNTVWKELNKAQQTKLASTPEPQLAQIGDLVGQLHGVPTKQVVQILVQADSAKAQIAALNAVIHGVPASKVVQILTDAHGATMQLAALNAAVRGVPASKVIAILHNAAPAAQKMHELAGAVGAVPGSKNVNISTNAGAAASAISGVRGALDMLHDRTITITTNSVTAGVTGASGKKASGRGRGQAEAAMVGEGGGPEYVIDSQGRGAIVSGPTLMGLGPQDYVVPTESRFRGRALGLFAMLARDLEVPGYKAGKAPAKAKAPARHPMPIPDAIPAFSLPVDDIKTKQEAAKSTNDTAQGKVHSLEGQVRTASKGKDKRKLSQLQKQLAHEKQVAAADRRHYQEWTQALHHAEAFQKQINLRKAEADNATNQMKLSAARNDFGGYTAAKSRRLGALGQLGALIKQARAQVKGVSEWGLKLEGEALSAEQETISTQGEAFLSPEAEAEARTGMTAAEVAEQKRIERDVALSALTPSLADDTAHAQELVGFLSRVLGEAQAEPGVRGGDETITSIAQALHTAQGNLASLSGSGTNENADLQAQITQANQKAETAQRTAQIAEQALAVFGGSGDIGAGGRNAAGAAQIVQNVYTLHPGDPATLTAIGNAATAGIGLQGSRQAVRTSVGP